MASLYRLFCVCFMLRNVSIPGAGTPHDYPKRQLSYMLLLTHWKNASHVTWQLLDGHINLFNEEYGEAVFSILSRSVLGDNIKSDFDHMNKIFKLLPIYRDVKKDIMRDADISSNSITWHHTIQNDSQEVTATTFFFQRTIRSILANRYKSYQSTSEYGSSHEEQVKSNTRYFIDQVFDPEAQHKVEPVFDKVKKDLSGNWVGKHSEIWMANNSELDQSTISQMSVESKSDFLHVANRNNAVNSYGPAWSDCVINHYAIARHEHDDQHLLCVYKIVEKLPIEDDQDTAYAQFQGKEYICTKPNTDIHCLTGAWNYIPARSTTELIENWCVLVYFDKLSSRNRLPDAVRKFITEYNNIDPLF